ncbi:MAG: site-specific DNA-methyltransferase, partial [Anaerolineae bacterium]|nr:site-specific DNA-methyltransferase [Anaerolineae bacterium]
MIEASSNPGDVVLDP